MKWDQVGQVGHGISTALLPLLIKATSNMAGIVNLMSKSPPSLTSTYCYDMNKWPKSV